MNCYLALKLEGFLQSWGGHTHEETRPTGAFPTKSGVVGLVGNAMGLRYGDLDRLREVDESVSMSVRIDKPGSVLVDFHTVEGYPKVNGAAPETIVTRRHYLLLAEFTVLLKGSREDLERYARALKKPARCLYLGRRVCIPSRPVFDSIVEAVDLRSAFSLVDGNSGGPIWKEGSGKMSLRIRDRRIYRKRQFLPRTYSVLQKSD